MTLPILRFELKPETQVTPGQKIVVARLDRHATQPPYIFIERRTTDYSVATLPITPETPPMQVNDIFTQLIAGQLLLQTSIEFPGTTLRFEEMIVTF
ncbi:hypothetical protein A2899_03845 [Candidatus Amesbacteria bacterium RIFCSPLOWO2_01_FULL_49_25]|nr:MAG: hypothetical protein A2899_03845 [Candidatus Amesbacteria bacterium RIFCSPLOWO2_01_FULL_49_25]